MFYKFVIPDHSVQSSHNIFLSLAYTELSTEPSIIHSHPYYEILFPKNDLGVLFCNQKDYPLSRNLLYIIPPNVSHSERNINQYNASKYFSIKTQVPIIPDNADIPIPLSVNIEKKFQKIDTYLSYALDSFKANDTDLALLNLACFQTILYSMLNAQSPNFQQLISQKPPTKNFMQEIKNYLEHNFSETINLEELSRKYLLSHSSLTKNFKLSYGMTPKEYLINIRIQKAADLLTTSNYQISSIASFCGFLSPAHFTMRFREFFGVSPKEYRKKLKQ